MTTITLLPPPPFLPQMQLFDLETPVQTELPICLVKSSFPNIALPLRYLLVNYKMGLCFTLKEAQGLLKGKLSHVLADNQTRFQTQVG